MSTRNGSSFLIVLTGSLGDIARGLALVGPLKASSEGASVTWLVEDRWSSLVQNADGIDRVIVFERKKGVRGFLQALKELRSQAFDVVFDLQRNLKSGVFSRAARAQRRVGFSRKDSKEFNWLFSSERIPFFGDAIPKIEHYLKFLDQLKIQRPQKLSFGFERKSGELLSTGLEPSLPHLYFGTVLGSSWPSKDWLPPGYHECIQLLLNRYPDHSVVLLGDSSQSELAARLTQALNSDRVISLVGKTSLVQLLGVLKGADVVVGPDSGPGHLSAAVGTPYVSLFGATDPIRTAPYGMLDYVVRVPLGCSPCMRRECPGLNRLCMRLIQPVEVFSMIQRALKR